MSPTNKAVLPAHILLVWMVGLGASCALAEPTKEPQRFIPVYVEPYYQSANTPGGLPVVRVASRFDTLLMSSNPQDILSVEALVQDQPDFVSPMSMMALALRMYDVGLREKSVFWFYAAKNRLFSVAQVLNFSAPSLSQAWQATESFAVLAGPYINGFAFCDKARQQSLARDAVAWTLAHPYRVVESDGVPRKNGDYKALWRAGINRVVASQRDEEAWMEDASNAKRFDENRKSSFAAERFCW